jgi:transposase InsO family protein
MVLDAWLVDRTLASQRLRHNRHSHMTKSVGIHEAKVIIEDWRIQYNTYRPHSALGGLTPAEYAQRENDQHQPDHA